MMTYPRTRFSIKYISRLLVGIVAPLCLFGPPAFAQSPNTVTINFTDGDGLTGEVLDVTDTTIRLDTSVGAVTIPLADVTCIGAACPDAVRQSIADLPTVVLSTPDGAVQLAGSLLEIADDQYVLATEAGEMRLNISDVNCEGDACQSAQVDFAFGGPVVLESEAAVVEGILTGLDDDSYFVEVDVLGSLRVSRDFVCNGAGCPPN